MNCKCFGLGFKAVQFRIRRLETHGIVHFLTLRFNTGALEITTYDSKTEFGMEMWKPSLNRDSFISTLDGGGRRCFNPSGMVKNSNKPRSICNVPIKVCHHIVRKIMHADLDYHVCVLMKSGQ